jgi:ribosome biogenesis protein Tsr3
MVEKNFLISIRIVNKDHPDRLKCGSSKMLRTQLIQTMS